MLSKAICFAVFVITAVVVFTPLIVLFMAATTPHLAPVVNTGCRPDAVLRVNPYEQYRS